MRLDCFTEDCSQAQTAGTGIEKETNMSHGLLPVNLTTGGLRTSVARAGLSGAAAGEPDATAQEAIQVPEASDLSMWEQENYQLTASAAGSLGFPLWSASTDDHVKIILFGISRYCDLSSGEHTFRYGVAIRVLLEILDVKGDAKLGLPAIAAQVELGDLQASSLLLVS